jgi:hypothetical protein
MAESFDLVILNATNGKDAIAFAKAGSDMAIGQLSVGTGLNKLSQFQKRISRALSGMEKRPTRAEVTEFGRNLFATAIQNDLVRLYNRLPIEEVSLHIVSNIPEIRSLAWEYIQEPDQVPGPTRNRCVVRVLPTIGVPARVPARLPSCVKVMFVCADPLDQAPVSWLEVKTSIERTFAARIPDQFSLEAVESADRDQLTKALQKNSPDIFHFSGHGEIRNGKGHLVLVDRQKKRSDFLAANELGMLLANRGIRLVVLSACETATGDFADSFSVISEALIHAGIPAVLANQLPVPDQSVAIFVGAMYQELLQSGNIDVAVSEGRIALAMNLNAFPDTPLEWGIPALYRVYGGARIYVR